MTNIQPFDSTDRPRNVGAMDLLNEALSRSAAVDLSWIGAELDDRDWALAPDALRFITSLVTQLRPRHILEFGSGISTRVLARAASAQPGRCCITSVDHDPEFGGKAATDYFQHPEDGCTVTMQIAPIVARDCGGKLLPVYFVDRSQVCSLEPVDLVVVDGPTTVLGGREGVLYQALEFARAGTIVLIDDADRAAERDALKHWQESLGDAIEVILLKGFKKGMAAVIVHRVVTPADLSRHRLGLTRSELSLVISPSDTVLTPGGDWWLTEVGTPCRMVPFPERDGQAWGDPASDHDAILEIERLQSLGADYFVLGWPAFWWKDYYTEFFQYLRLHYRCVIDNDRAMLFALNHRHAR